METMNELYSDLEFVRMSDERAFQSMRSNTGWLLNPVDMSPIEFKLT